MGWFNPISQLTQLEALTRVWCCDKNTDHMFKIFVVVQISPKFEEIGVLFQKILLILILSSDLNIKCEVSVVFYQALKFVYDLALFFCSVCTV